MPTPMHAMTNLLQALRGTAETHAGQTVAKATPDQPRSAGSATGDADFATTLENLTRLTPPANAAAATPASPTAAAAPALTVAGADQPAPDPAPAPTPNSLAAATLSAQPITPATKPAAATHASPTRPAKSATTNAAPLDIPPPSAMAAPPPPPPPAHAPLPQDAANPGQSASAAASLAAPGNAGGGADPQAPSPTPTTTPAQAAPTTPAPHAGDPHPATDAPTSAAPAAASVAALGVSAMPSASVAPPQPTGPARLATSGNAGTTPPSAPADQIAPVLLRLTTTDGARQISLQLTPHALGRVDIAVDQPQNGPVTVKLTAERPETLALLQQDQSQLSHALDRAGLPAENRVISFHLATPHTPAIAPPDAVAATGTTPDLAGSFTQSGHGGSGSQDLHRYAAMRNAAPGAAPGAASDDDAASLDAPFLATQPAGFTRASLNITA